MQQQCSNILLADPHPIHPSAWKGPLVKIQPFQSMDMLHIKITGIMKWSNMVTNKVTNVLHADPLPYYPHIKVAY